MNKQQFVLGESHSVYDIKKTICCLILRKENDDCGRNLRIGHDFLIKRSKFWPDFSYACRIYLSIMKEKVLPRYFDGYKFVRLSDLPQHQAHLFSSWTSTITGPAPTELMVADNDIVSYDDYSFWFDYHYVTEKDLDELI